MIFDSGPLVALIDGRDHRHAEVRELLKVTAPPILVCEAVLSEAFFLLRRAKGGERALRELMRLGKVVVEYSMRGDEQVIGALMSKYADVPMSLADACLVRMCELERRARLYTFDSDFTVYRLSNRRRVPIIS